MELTQAERHDTELDALVRIDFNLQTRQPCTRFASTSGGFTYGLTKRCCLAYGAKKNSLTDSKFVKHVITFWQNCWSLRLSSDIMQRNNDA